MTRQTLQFLFLFALFSFATATALGALSHWRGLLVGRIGAGQSLYVRSGYGKLMLHHNRSDAGEKPRWLASSWTHKPAWSAPWSSGWWQQAGFDYGVGGTQGGNVLRQLSIPYWFLSVGSLVLAAALFFASRWRGGPFFRFHIDKHAAGRIV